MAATDSRPRSSSATEVARLPHKRRLAPSAMTSPADPTRRTQRAIAGTSTPHGRWPRDLHRLLTNSDRTQLWQSTSTIATLRSLSSHQTAISSATPRPSASTWTTCRPPCATGACEPPYPASSPPLKRMAHMPSSLRTSISLKPAPKDASAMATDFLEAAMDAGSVAKSPASPPPGSATAWSRWATTPGCRLLPSILPTRPAGPHSTGSDPCGSITNRRPGTTRLRW